MKHFRTLTAGEIECRVSQVSETQSGVRVSVLLYKDARVDQNILDEMFGTFGWKRTHELIGDRLYCTVSVKDRETGEWVSKQDVGTESNTEPEKGQASDAFKRACFNWGIGRELYTAPKILITLNEKEINRNGGKLRTYAAFCVKSISYDASGTISGLVIADRNGNERFRFGEGLKNPAAAQSPAPQPKTEAPPEKLRCTDKAFLTLVTRLSNGEDILRQADSTYAFTETQQATLRQYRKTNPKT